MHAKRQEVRQCRIEVGTAQKRVLVMIAEHPLHPLRRYFSLLLLAQELSSTLNADLRELERRRQINVGTCEIEFVLLCFRPPALVDGVIDEIVTGQIPFGADRRLVGDRGDTPRHASGHPPRADRLQNPGFLSIGDDVRVVVPTCLVVHARNAGTPLTVPLDKSRDHIQRFAGRFATLKP